MFVLYGLVVGLAVGAALGGRLGRLSHVRLRWTPLIAVAMVVQLLLFGPLAGLLGPGDPRGVALFLASSLAGLAATLANVRQRGLLLIFLGALLNQVAIIANGGVMPASAAALAVLGWTGEQAGFSNSAHLGAPALPWLTDVFALPPWVPFANVFSVGDVLIATGFGAFVALTMLRPREPAEGTPPAGGLGFTGR